MTPLEKAVKRAWAKGFGPGLADPPFGEDDAKDIISAFLEAAAGDENICESVGTKACPAYEFAVFQGLSGKAAILALKETING